MVYCVRVKLFVVDRSKYIYIYVERKRLNSDIIVKNAIIYILRSIC